jgi:hypothetical protein
MRLSGNCVLGECQMKRLILVSLLVLQGCLLTTPLLQANPCVSPRRLVNGYTVNIQPLFEWWGSPKGLRPLASWKHVRGVIARETQGGWVVTGKVEGHSRTETFLLKNPPQDRLLRYHELQRQLAESQRASDATREFLKRPVATDWYTVVVSQGQAPPITLAEYRDAQARLDELIRTTHSIGDDLRSLQDHEGHFAVDAFALRVNDTWQGITVLDHGSTTPFREATAAN